MFLSDWLITLFYGTEFYFRTQLFSIQPRKTEKTGRNKENRGKQGKPGENRKRPVFTGILNFVVRVKNPSIGPDHSAFSCFQVVSTSPRHGIKIQFESESGAI